MSSDIVIRAEHLSKRFRLGARNQRYRTFRDALTQTILAPVRNLRRLGKAAPPEETMWALKDISFEVRRGQVAGFIGHNGAGKSTLLKILSRITEPTEGSARIEGRLAALLEVGTGFHPELSGRDNVFLNGTILGMRRAEIQRKFDDIVNFAEVERFIDTPVKHYSSGMYLRLAFAVAAHLEPEIMVIDEVLAVGDAAFQQKCLGKMEEVSKQGRTVLFVSHNMAAIANLCDIVFCLDHGRVADSGETSAVIRAYLAKTQVAGEESLLERQSVNSNREAKLIAIRLLRNNEPCGTFQTLEPFELEVECRIDPQLAQQMALGFKIIDSRNTCVFGSNISQYAVDCPNLTGHARFRAKIDPLFLSPGMYSLTLILGNGLHNIDAIEDAIHFNVIWDARLDLSTPPNPGWGPLFSKVDWSYEPQSAP